MPSTRSSLPVKLHPVLDDLYRTLVAEPDDDVKKAEMRKARMAWKRDVARTLKTWKAEQEALTPEDIDHAAVLLALELLAERVAESSESSTAVEPALVGSQLGQIDERDFALYKRCEISLERPSKIAAREGVARDEVLRRWSRARQSISDRVKEA